MFNKKKINLERIENLEKQLREKDSEAIEERRSFESQMRILRNEIDLKISEAVMREKKVTENVNQENAVLKKEVEILNKAFENMGFDVKDMKEILNKLVDGIVAKSDIKILNTNNGSNK